MPDNVFVVFTYRTVDQIIAEGGSQAWALKANNARRCEYLVCTRNRFHEGSGPEPHHSAFLVGKISSVEAAPERPDRWIVRISDYAEIAVPEVWPGSRNPVWYVETLEKLGINPTKLDWKSMPLRGLDAAVIRPDPTEDAEASVEDLKLAVSVAFGVPVENVEVTIRL